MWSNSAWLLAADDTRPSSVDSFHCETIVPAPLADTFAFFADASNLERLTPAWLNFAVLSPMPSVIGANDEIDYRITLYGLPVPWRSRIDVWEPGIRFVDRQLVGPYRWWRHEHRFQSAPRGGTQVVDAVEYTPRMRWLTAGLVRRDLERVFSYRQNALIEIFSERNRK